MLVLPSKLDYIYEAPEDFEALRFDARILTNCGVSENREPSMATSGRSPVLGTWRSGTLQYQYQ